MSCRNKLWAIAAVGACVIASLLAARAPAQSFAYEAKPRAASTGLSSSYDDPAPPRFSAPSEAIHRRAQEHREQQQANRYPRYTGNGRVRTARADSSWQNGPRPGKFVRTSAAEPIPAGNQVDPFEEIPPGESVSEGPGGANYGGNFDGNFDGQLSPDEYYDGQQGYGSGAYDSCGDCGGCSRCGCYGGFFPCMWRCIRNSALFSPCLWENINTFGGAQAFKGPVDQGVNGNFGFHKGFNWATPFWDACGIGHQLGAALAFSDFDGGGGSVNHSRTQFFATSGLFRRATDDHGFQGGAVVDYLYDDFYVTMNLLQIRAELSYMACHNEVGVWCAVHANNDTQLDSSSFRVPQDVTWQSLDQYNIFYRHLYCNGGYSRMWIGLTGQGDVMWGADASAPLSQNWALQATYNYLMPTSNSDNGVPKSVQETWGLTFGVVWYPGYRSSNAGCNPYRPLFNVADNALFMLRNL